jgi:putative flippase GtrA
MAIQAPNRKVTVGLVAGSVMMILAWVSKTYAGVEIPADVALAGATVITFVLQYVIPDATQEPPSA